jgi:hypothetical protein
LYVALFGIKFLPTERLRQFTIVLKDNPMTDNNNIARRLALLEGVEFSPADLEAIVTEVEDLQRVVAELEEFAQATPWIALQTQPAGKKVGS